MCVDDEPAFNVLIGLARRMTAICSIREHAAGRASAGSCIQTSTKTSKLWRSCIAHRIRLWENQSSHQSTCRSLQEMHALVPSLRFRFQALIPRSILPDGETVQNVLAMVQEARRGNQETEFESAIRGPTPFSFETLSHAATRKGWVQGVDRRKEQLLFDRA